MITLKVTDLTDLDQQSISVKKDSEITFQDKLYKKAKVLSKREEEKAFQIAEEYRANDSEILIVEHKLFFSIWVEQTRENPAETSNNQQPIKKIIKKYRGISYEVEVPETDHQNTAASVKPRKYRGKSY